MHCAEKLVVKQFDYQKYRYKSKTFLQKELSEKTLHGDICNKWFLRNLHTHADMCAQ